MLGACMAEMGDICEHPIIMLIESSHILLMYGVWYAHQ